MSRDDDDLMPIRGTGTAAGGEWINRTGDTGEQPEPLTSGAGRQSEQLASGAGRQSEQLACDTRDGRRRQDPCVAGAFTCHHCLDSGQVWNVDRATATMTAEPCPCTTTSDG